jgi:purine-binding chemotaxis protein CheW
LNIKVLTFYIGKSLFGINITLIKEINRNVEFTSVPDANENVVGLFNMRGQIVTLFSLEKIIGINMDEKCEKLTCIILKSPPNDPNQLGFIIDKPGDVVDIESDECEIPPANVGIIEGEYISSVVKLRDELLIIIEPARIFKL